LRYLFSILSSLHLSLSLSLWLQNTVVQVHFLTAGSLLDRAENRAAEVAVRRSHRRLVLVSSELELDGGMGRVQFSSNANGGGGGNGGLAFPASSSFSSSLSSSFSSPPPPLSFEVFARRSGGDYAANGRLLAQLSSASSTPCVAAPVDTRGPTCVLAFSDGRHVRLRLLRVTATSLVSIPSRRA